MTAIIRLLSRYWLSISTLILLSVLNVLKLPKVVMAPKMFGHELSLDKWHHAFAYLVFMIIMSYELKKGYGGNKSLLLASLISICVGVAMETIQYFLPYRTFNPYDLVANGLGVLSAVILIFLRHKFQQLRLRK